MDKKVAIVSKVIQHWRAPIYQKLSLVENIKVFHGPDFLGTKVLNTKEKWDFNKKKLKSLKIKFKSKNGIVTFPISGFLLFNLISYNPSVVVAEGASNIFDAIQTFIYAKIFRKKFVWWSLGKIKGRDYDKTRKKIDCIIKFIEKKSDSIITYSSFGKEYFISLGIDSSKIYIATNVVDTEAKIKEAQNLDKHKIWEDSHINSNLNVLYVGALTKQKKIDTLIKSFAKLEKKYSLVALNIVGGGSFEKEARELAAKLESKAIKFHGQQIKKVNKYFLASDVLVMPGLGGLVISEAMLYGLAVVCSVGDGCEQDLVDSTNGFFDPNLNEEKLFNYLEKLLLDKKLLSTMKQNSYRKIATEFNVGVYIKNFVAAINH